MQTKNKENNLMEKIVSLCKRHCPVKFLTGQGISFFTFSASSRGATLSLGGSYEK